jgi:glycosyltransferase involved in cell wall biosynthesis
VRVAYVITRADAVGGASVHVRDMARYLAGLGHSVKVFIGGEGPVVQQLQEAGVACQRLRFLQRAIHPLRDLRAVRELASSLAEFQPDLISLHTAKAGFLGRIAASRLSVPVLYTPHGWAFGERFPLVSRSAFLLAERLVAARSAAVLCVCAHERELALRRGVGWPGLLRVVYNAVHDVPAGLRADAGRSPVRLVSVTRLESPKDPVTLFHALGRLRDRAWDLDLVGDGPMEPGLKRLAGALGIGDRIQFLGYQPDPAPILAGAQVFVLSSGSEGFPRSILEALRAGLPVVASRVGGVAEAIAAGENGLLVPPADGEALAAALASLMDNAELRAGLGEQARRSYEARFRFERMAGELLTIYREFV